MFTTNWFQDNGKNWINWLNKFIGKPNLRFLEIGCFEGRATVWLLENILIDKTSHIIAIDTFQGSIEHIKRKLNLSEMYKNFIENTKDYESKIKIKKGFSQIILRKLPLGYFDFIYIDGSHIASDVLEDTILSWRLLKKGGILIWDDYTWEMDLKKEIETPKIAIDIFLKCFEGKYKIISKDRQVCIEKL
jgi:predicted O-methyltransferase YrrM